MPPRKQTTGERIAKRWRDVLGVPARNIDLIFLTGAIDRAIRAAEKRGYKLGRESNTDWAAQCERKDAK